MAELGVFVSAGSPPSTLVGPLEFKSLFNLCFVSVKDFGAVADGVTDDAEAINAAILAVYNAGGGTVSLPAGTMLIGDTIILRSEVSIKGAGQAASIIKLAASADCDVMATLTDVDTYIGTGNVSVGERYITLADFGIDGNKENNATGRGIAAYWYLSHIERIAISNCSESGIYEGWGNFGSPQPLETMENTYTGVVVEECDDPLYSWYHDGPHDSKFNGNTVCQGADGQNALMHIGSYGSGAMFVSCHNWSELGVNQVDWSLIVDGNGVMWCNSTAEGGHVGQIKVRGPDFICMGGWQYCANSAFSQIGIQIGDSANGFTNISGYYIQTKLTNLIGGALVFNSDGGLGYISVIGYNAAAATAYSGTKSATSYIRIQIDGVGGGAGYFMQEPRDASLMRNVGVGGAFSATEKLKVYVDRAVTTYGLSVNTFNGASFENSFVSIFNGTHQLLGNFEDFPLSLITNNTERMQLGTSSGTNSSVLPFQLPTYTTATRPTASGMPRALIYVSDAGAGSLLQYSNGSNWVAAG